ncbi:hypothetical protein [Natronorubrum halophilum]|nr:hypothetical protein [Natronorubrum halophilum]
MKLSIEKATIDREADGSHRVRASRPYSIAGIDNYTALATERSNVP